jgi:hypothetical protein
MVKVLVVAVGIIIHIPDDDASVCAPVTNDPLDDFAEILRDEMRYGRDTNRGPMKAPGVTVGMAAAYQECPDRN